MGKKIKKFKPKISIIFRIIIKENIRTSNQILISQTTKLKALIIDDKSGDNSKKILKGIPDIRK